MQEKLFREILRKSRPKELNTTLDAHIQTPIGITNYSKNYVFNNRLFGKCTVAQAVNHFGVHDVSRFCSNKNSKTFWLSIAKILGLSNVRLKRVNLEHCRSAHKDSN